jgi:hypothetical protein
MAFFSIGRQNVCTILHRDAVVPYIFALEKTLSDPERLPFQSPVPIELLRRASIEVWLFTSLMCLVAECMSVALQGGRSHDDQLHRRFCSRCSACRRSLPSSQSPAARPRTSRAVSGGPRLRDCWMKVQFEQGRCVATVSETNAK